VLECDRTLVWFGSLILMVGWFCLFVRQIIIIIIIIIIANYYWLYYCTNVDCLIWLIDWLICLVGDWLVDCLVEWLIDWVIDWLFDGFDWLVMGEFVFPQTTEQIATRKTWKSLTCRQRSRSRRGRHGRVWRAGIPGRYNGQFGDGLRRGGSNFRPDDHSTVRPGVAYPGLAMKGAPSLV
jgi:hypothetical protein